MNMFYIFLTCGLTQVALSFFFEFIKKQMMFNKFEQMGIPKRQLDPIERAMLMTQVTPYMLSLHKFLFKANLVCNVIVAAISMYIFL